MISLWEEHVTQLFGHRAGTPAPRLNVCILRGYSGTLALLGLRGAEEVLAGVLDRRAGVTVTPCIAQGWTRVCTLQSVSFRPSSSGLSSSSLVTPHLRTAQTRDTAAANPEGEDIIPEIPVEGSLSRGGIRSPIRLSHLPGSWTKAE